MQPDQSDWPARQPGMLKLSFSTCDTGTIDNQIGMHATCISKLSFSGFTVCLTNPKLVVLCPFSICAYMGRAKTTEVMLVPFC